jgi:serine/threonine-protein kinase
MTGKLHKKEEVLAKRYQVLEFVGEGGMQEVYKARDFVLQREVALKVPKNSSAEKRFKRSAVLSARVNHPNVAKTLDYFETAERPYLIEEFVVGRDLRKILAEEIKLLDPYLAAHIFHHLSKGVAASHHVGVVHRDLKPSNIMVVGGLEMSEVKITDFGIAKMAMEELAEAVAGGVASITGSQTMVGALPYMAPEMITDPRNADTPSDVWALGAILYELITGTRPFGSGLQAVPRITSGEVPAKPDLIDYKTQFKPLGNQLFNIILSCLKKEPGERPSADDLTKECETLCYPVRPHSIGTIRRYIYNTCGFIKDTESGDDVFFHLDSVYGQKPSIGDRVSFTAYLGGGACRAHPIILLRKEE